MDTEIVQERFGSLLSIPDCSIVALASAIRFKIFGVELPSHLVSRLNGSYNLVYIVEFDDGVKYVVRVPAVGWGDRLTETARNSLESQALTMRFIKKETMLPLPDVYDFDTTTTNGIGAPYMVMSFIPGSTVSSLWFDKSGPMPLEERRMRTLDTVAKAMSQLQLTSFRFDKIGSLQFTDGTANQPTIGPCYKWDEGKSGDERYGKRITVTPFGPFHTSQSFLRYCLDHDSDNKRHMWSVGARQLVGMMIPCLPRPPENQRETFVLSLPDFDSQNVMTDESGSLTGIIDWDNVQTNPLFLGYSCFPSWITTDWDPLMYCPTYDGCNSPEELKRYRHRYNNEMRKWLHGNGDSIFTAESHIFEAVEIAAKNPDCRVSIVSNIVKHVLPDCNEWSVAEDVAERKLTPKEMRKLKQGLQALLSIGRW